MAAKNEPKVKLEKIKREPKTELKQEPKQEPKQEAKKEAKHEAKVKPGTNTKLDLDELARRGQAMRLKNEESKRAKREPKTTTKRKRKQRVTAKRRNSSREVMHRPHTLSTEMADFIGEPRLSRPEVVKKIWAYAKENDLLDPSNKKEIVCDAKLQHLLGVQRAKMLQLTTYVNKHVEYAADIKEESAPVKTSPKRQRKVEEKQELKEEKKELKVKTKSSKQEQKKELAASSYLAPSAARVEAVAKSLRLRVNGMFQQRLALEFKTPDLELDQLRFEFVAVPSKPATNELRRPCHAGARENAEGDFESVGEGLFEGLAANASYTVFVEVEGAGHKLRSREISIPQRASPGSWQPHEVQSWALTLRVPEFTQKLAAYNVNGATLLTLGEADLHSFGLAAPFLRRRVSDALKVISAWSI